MTESAAIERSGLFAALGAHAFWGAMPLYLLLVRHVPPLEFVAWRIVLTLPLCLVVIAAWRQRAELIAVLRDRRALLTLCATAAMVASNWYLYVHAIDTGHVYAASLGYYILPLIMVLFGRLFLGERLSRQQAAAVTLAGIGVAVLAAGALSTLWLSLAMALTFGTYGLLRKTVAAGALVGLTVESLVLFPAAVALALWYATSGHGAALHSGTATALAIAGSGPMTAIPLLLFSVAARRLPYTLLGFLQFISPTAVFIIGLTVFGEPLNPAQLACFMAIWVAVALFTWDLLRRPKARAA